MTSLSHFVSLQPIAWHIDIYTVSESVGVAYAQLYVQNKVNG